MRHRCRQGGEVQARCAWHPAAAARLRAQVAQPLDDAVLHLGGEHGAENRDAHGATQGAEEGDGRGGRADVADVDGVLDGEDEVLHHRAEPDAHDGHVEAHLPQGRGVVQGAEADQAQHQADPAADEELLPASGAADDLAGPVEETSRPAISGMVSRPACGGRVAAGDLEVLARKVVPPNIAMPTAALATMTRAAVRLRRTLSGTSGSGHLSSTTTARASGTAVPPR